MNLKLKDVFRGKVVNKALTINTGVDEFPRYVVEYLQQKLLAAYEAGIKEVLIPADNVADTNFIPVALKEKLTITPVQRVNQVLEKALLP